MWEVNANVWAKDGSVVEMTGTNSDLQFEVGADTEVTGNSATQTTCDLIEIDASAAPGGGC